MRFVVVNRFRFITFIVIVILLLSLLISGLINTIHAASVKNKSISEDEYIKITVQSGDTLWKICKENNNTKMELRRYISKVIKINNMDCATIYPGDIIMLPVK